MSKARLWRGRPGGLLCIAFFLLGVSWGAAVPAAQGAGADPLFVFAPQPPPPPAPPLPPPLGYLEGPCGLGVDPLGHFYVSDYYHDAIDVYDQNADYNAKGATGATGFIGQRPGIDPLDGPCGLAFDATSLYVNSYHRSVLHYSNIFAAPTTLVGPTPPGAENPTGMDVDPASANVYVDQRTYISAFDSSGAPLEEGGEPIHIGEGSLQDGYGVAFSRYPGTAGRLYVPDAATNTIEVYDSATPQAGPVEAIDGTETPAGEFVSLRDASIAVDRVTGEIYVIDDLQARDTEFPQAIVDVFKPDGTYEGHLKFLITWGMPAGLAVDNSETATQGRVYVTSGNSIFGAIYAYGPGSATTAPIKLAIAKLSLASLGSGEGAITSSLGGSCSAACEEALPAGASVTLSAEAGQGSSFAGWSGACQGTEPTCTVGLQESSAVGAGFAAQAAEGSAPSTGASPVTAPIPAPRKARPHKRAHRRGTPRRRKGKLKAHRRASSAPHRR